LRCDARATPPATPPGVTLNGRFPAGTKEAASKIKSCPRREFTLETQSWFLADFAATVTGNFS